MILIRELDQRQDGYKLQREQIHKQVSIINRVLVALEEIYTDLQVGVKEGFFDDEDLQKVIEIKNNLSIKDWELQRQSEKLLKQIYRVGTKRQRIEKKS